MHCSAVQCRIVWCGAVQCVSNCGRPGGAGVLLLGPQQLRSSGATLRHHGQGSGDGWQSDSDWGKPSHEKGNTSGHCLDEGGGGPKYRGRACFLYLDLVWPWNRA